jgi:hypothetical protein
VDNTSFPLGNGRFVVTHRNAGDRLSNRTYHSAWFVAAGTTRNDAERIALETLVKDASFRSSTRNSTKEPKEDGEVQQPWGNFNGRFWDDFPNPTWWVTKYPPFCEWNTSVSFSGPGGSGELSVSRLDLFGQITASCSAMLCSW